MVAATMNGHVNAEKLAGKNAVENAFDGKGALSSP
jgi:hypothetical protein